MNCFIPTERFWVIYIGFYLTINNGSSLSLPWSFFELMNSELMIALYLLLDRKKETIACSSINLVRNAKAPKKNLDLRLMSNNQTTLIELEEVSVSGIVPRTNEDLTKPSPNILLLCQRSYFRWFANSGQFFFCQESMRCPLTRERKQTNFQFEKFSRPPTRDCRHGNL